MTAPRNPKRIVALASGLALAAYLPTALAAASAANIATHGAGSAVPACMSCHGAAGEGNAAAGFPRLAGLPAAYIAAQLRAFAQGTRSNSLMSPIAKAMSDAQIIAVANYYAKLPKPVQTYGPMPAAAALGERLAERGDWSTGIPSCFRCHGPGGMGVSPDFPPIVGQPASYIESQIKAWKDGSRHNDPMGLMHTVALRMSDAATQSVAAWLAAEKPGEAARSDKATH
ncbi:c-type cytochrome [Thiomonas sp. FB-Cd]|uniref:c-type cytochrome n=1 Tax=Thiomonas sp. FB-Cd TaxID=1158292 RepID=UPI00068F812F|nr:c-type cytochrome [Thiomonas sp. FB-Cd]